MFLLVNVPGRAPESWRAAGGQVQILTLSSWPVVEMIILEGVCCCGAEGGKGTLPGDAFQGEEHSEAILQLSLPDPSPLRGPPSGSFARTAEASLSGEGARLLPPFPLPPFPPQFPSSNTWSTYSPRHCAQPQGRLSEKERPRLCSCEAHVPD